MHRQKSMGIAGFLIGQFFEMSIHWLNLSTMSGLREHISVIEGGEVYMSHHRPRVLFELFAICCIMGFLCFSIEMLYDIWTKGIFLAKEPNTVVLIIETIMLVLAFIYIISQLFELLGTSSSQNHKDSPNIVKPSTAHMRNMTYASMFNICQKGSRSTIALCSQRIGAQMKSICQRLTRNKAIPTNAKKVFHLCFIQSPVCMRTMTPTCRSGIKQFFLSTVLLHLKP